MTDRRRFLQTAAALSAAPLAARVAFAEGRPALLLDALVVDERHREARAFGSRARSLGAPVRPIDGDITQLWQHELLGRWRARPAAVAGLTERPALFLLERLGWDHSLRVVFQAEHAANGAGGFRHTLRRSGASDLALDLAAAGPGWPAVLADALVAGSPPPARNLRPTDAALAARDEATTLYSWIIAPRQA